MQSQFSRTELIYGKRAMERLFSARVAVFGLGGVGGYAVEALARSGIGALDLIDDDRVTPSNLNRQILATVSSIGEYKVDLAERRIKDINPSAKVRCFRLFLSADNIAQFDFKAYDYVIDAIDTVISKLLLVQSCHEAGTPIISCMGAGNRLDPTAFKVTDISKTSGCPLARVMRKELGRQGIRHLKVVCSSELPIAPMPEDAEPEECAAHPKRQTPGSNAFVPAAAGLAAAGAVINDLASPLPER